MNKKIRRKKNKIKEWIAKILKQDENNQVEQQQEESESEWISHKDIDYYDDSICQIHVDTRSFSCLIQKEEADFVSFPSDLNEEFCSSREQVKRLIEDLFGRSGGEAEWRMLVIIDEIKMKRIQEDDGKPKKESIYAEFTDSFWDLKYLRFYKYKNEFVVCTKDDKLIKKSFFENKIDDGCLNTMKCYSCKKS